MVNKNKPKLFTMKKTISTILVLVITIACSVVNAQGVIITDETAITADSSATRASCC